MQPGGFVEQRKRRIAQIGNDRPAHLYGIILFGHGTKVVEVIGAVVDAADKANFAIDHQDLAV
ncbi:hypothetical protein D3C77_752750 [compost metagenome]